MQIRKDLRDHFIRLKGNVLENFNRVRSVESIFSSAYKNHTWGDEESVSGTGSRMQETKRVMQTLAEVFQRYGIRTMLDIPCGDFNWMQHVDLSAVDYYGADIVDSLVNRNIGYYAAPHINFFSANIIKDRLPRVDLIFCRDCFVHFSHKRIFESILRVKESHSRFLLTTTFPDHSNLDIVTGSWRPLNLQGKPFCFPQPIAIFNEGYHASGSGIADKSLALWQISDLP